MENNHKIMFEHAIAKWQWTVDKWDYSKILYYNKVTMLIELPFLKNYVAQCSFCSAYPACSAKEDLYQIDRCPLKSKNQNCYDETSYFNIWSTHVDLIGSNVSDPYSYDIDVNIKTAKENAKKLLNLIKDLYKKELSKDKIK
jgi:hypothetical protein